METDSFGEIPADYSGSTGDPEAMGGVPAVMPSNDWWKLAGEGLRTYRDIQISKQHSGVAAPAGRVASNPMNPPPGGGGLWFQAASTPGAGKPVFLGSPASKGVMLAAAAAVVLVVVFLVLRR